jgi:two-component system, OmpR family, KDP operon response regulator KdpE
MNPQKILVVDDEPQMRRVLRAGLAAHGYEVVSAASGNEALTKLNVERCDCVLLDLNMPGLDGIATCRAIRQSSQIPIVIVSIRDSQKDRTAAREAGADDYVTKPFSLDDLLRHIARVSRGGHA